MTQTAVYQGNLPQGIRRNADDKWMKGTQGFRLIATSAAIALMGGLFAFPANAGTLTGATFTTNGSGYAVTNASNARYDWRYTTATAGITTRVETTVPTGTRIPGSRYLAMNRGNGNEASTPDSPANSLNTDIDVRVKVAFPTWTASGTGSYEVLVAKEATASNWSYVLYVNDQGRLFFQTTDGTTSFGNNVGPINNVVAGQPIWLRATRVLNNGSGSRVTTFYSSTDGSSWSGYGSPIVSAGTTSIYDSNAPLEVGNELGATGAAAKAKIYFASVTSGITGTTTSASACSSAGVVACFNPTDYANGTAFTSTSTQAETWTVNRSGTNLPADITTDLSVAEIAGLPSGGSASYRLIDGKAVYVLPTATSIASGTSVLLALSGFTNTATAGSYASTITTFDNSATPVAIDSATTSALSFADLAGTAVVGVAVDPTFSFTVATHAGACNSVAQTAGVTTGATGVALGRVNSAAGSIGAQDLSVGTNANTGFSLQLRTTGPLTAGANTIANAPGTNASPAAFPAATTAAFGYTVSGLGRFSSTWAGPETTNREVMNGASVGTVTNCIAYRVQVTASTPAGSYSTTSYYTAVPTF